MLKKTKIGLAIIAFCGVAYSTTASANAEGSEQGPGSGITCPTGSKYTCYNLWLEGGGQLVKQKGDGETTVEL